LLTFTYKIIKIKGRLPEKKNISQILTTTYLKLALNIPLKLIWLHGNTSL